MKRFNKFLTMLFFLSLAACGSKVNFANNLASASLPSPNPALNVSNPVNSPVMNYVPNWVHCGNEHGVCFFSGIKTIRFGINGQYVTQNFLSSADCANDYFDHDPAVGTPKGCDVDMNSSPATFQPGLIPQEIQAAGITALNVQAVSQYFGLTSDSNGVPFDWGNIFTTGAFIEFNLDFPETGNYKITTKHANVNSNALIYLLDEQNAKTDIISTTSGYGNYVWSAGQTMNIIGGIHRIRIQIGNFAGINISAVQIERVP